MNVRLFVVLTLLIGSGTGPARAVRPDPAAQSGVSTPPSSIGQARAGLNRAVDPAIDAIWSGFDERAAMGHVEFISQFWRLPGNTGYNASIDRIRARLTSAGFAERAAGAAPAAVPQAWIEEYPNQGKAWEYSAGSVAVVKPGQPDDVVLSKEKQRLTLCINSFSTVPGGVVAPLVDVGAGRDEDYAGKDLKGAVVLGNPDAGALWRKAVVGGGAIGVISTALPRYLDADPPNTASPTPRDRWDILQWTSVPYDEARKGFGFKASPLAAARLRRALGEATASSPATVRITD